MYTESKNPYNDSFSIQDIEKYIIKEEPICVKVLYIKKDDNALFCEISKYIYGILPIDEFEINLKKIKNHDNITIYPQIERILHSNITVCVIKKLNSPNIFLLSRKKSLKQAYEKLKHKNYITCEIIGINEYFWYVDCGHGVSGRISIPPSVLKYNNTSSTTDFKVGDLINAKISSFDDNTFRLKLSYISEVPIETVLNAHKLYDVVEVNVINRLNNISNSTKIDFYVQIIDSNEYAILDVTSKDNINIGEKLQCYIYGQKNNGKFKLSLIKKL